MARILVIDDQDSVREVLHLLLEAVGHQVLLAGGGEEVLRTFRREQADLVLCDVFMPGQDGLDVFRELRREFPRAKERCSRWRWSGVSAALRARLEGPGVLRRIRHLRPRGPRTGHGPCPPAVICRSGASVPGSPGLAFSHFSCSALSGARPRSALSK
jgi:CheY-like chemotaxis protein